MWIEWRSTKKGNRIYSSARDITERKIAEIQLKEKTDKIEAQNEEYKQINEKLYLVKEKAVESDRLKTAFLQNMSHEIRTPMNAIIGFSELLSLNFNNKQKLERFSGIITQRCNDLLDIINDLLEIAKIEAGQLPVKIQKCNIRILLDELTMFFEEYLKKQKKQHISLIIATGTVEKDIWALTDMVKLKQIFINLFGNAVKFTINGSIEVGYNIDNEQFITFFVKDTGIGIAKDKQQVIFERFAQIDNGPHRLYGGTGLGLSIVSGLLNILGGRIWLDSKPGKGSSFYFTIPRDVSNTREIEQDKPEITSSTIHHLNKSILIVEDDQFNAEYIKEVLKNKGLNLIFASSGNEAVEMTLTHMPDLILMEIRLPDISGFEAIQKIKKLKPAIKIIAQTAYALEDDRVKAMEAGCIDYISKPLKSELFLPMINKHLK
jgi:signal transduction histidine kinase